MDESAPSSERNEAFVFGEVADDYERVRPGYPEELIDSVLGYAGCDRPRILEIGAGTGKATLLLARRGLDVVAAEPSPEMANILLPLVAPYPNVYFQSATFEELTSDELSFDILLAAQSWHWLKDGKYELAAQLLRPDGVFAAFWNRAIWTERQTAEKQALKAVYTRLEPELIDVYAAYPGLSPYGREVVTAKELGNSPHFGSPVLSAFVQEIQYTVGEYIALLGTQSVHRMLDEDRRAALFGAIAEALTPFGETITVDIESRLVMSRIAGRREDSDLA